MVDLKEGRLELLNDKNSCLVLIDYQPSHVLKGRSSDNLSSSKQP